MNRKCELCSKEIAECKYNLSQWCSTECRDKWFKSVPEKYARVYGAIVKELKEELDYINNNMCKNCLCRL